MIEILLYHRPLLLRTYIMIVTCFIVRPQESERFSSLGGSCLTCKYLTRLERLMGDYLSSLFGLVVSDEEKKGFIILSLGVNFIKLFFFIADDKAK